MRQIAVVLLTSPDCSASDARAIGAVLRPYVDSVRARLASDSVEIRTIGVSVDRDPQRAFDHLALFMSFDEYAIGGDWTNTAAQRFAVSALSGPLGVPQVILISRHVSAHPGNVVGPDSLIARLLGVDGLTRWARRQNVRPDSSSYLSQVRGASN